MASLMATISEALREQIDQGIDDSLPRTDPTFTQIIKTSQGVIRGNRDGGIGRDWKALMTFCGSLSGAHAWRAAAGATATLDGSADNDGFSIYGSQTWQGLADMAGPGIIQKTVQLVEGYGNIPVPLHLLRSDRLDAAVGSMVGEIIRGASKLQVMSQVNAFWKFTPNGSIGTFSGLDATITTGSAFTLTGGRVRAFYVGMFLDVYLDSGGETTGSDLNNSQEIVITKVDYLKKQVTVRTVSGTASDSLASANTYHFVPRDSHGNVPNGLVDWIKDSSTVFGIDLGNYPQFRSVITSSESGALTSDKLNKYVGGFEDAYGTECDTVLTTPGVMLAFLENLDSTSQLIRYESQGKPLNVTAGFQPFGYVFNGRTYRFMTSPNCPIGTVYIIKLGQKNIKKFVPPRLGGARSDGRFSSEVEFVGPAFGQSSIFLPTRSSDKLADVLQAPYLNWCQFAPKMIQSIKLSTFDENIHTG